MTPYILNVAIVIAGCLAFYKVLLQKETFYRINRYVLIICLLIAFALPLLPVPAQFSFRTAPETSFVQLPAVSHANQDNGIVGPIESAVPPSQAINENVGSANIFTFDRLFTWISWLYWFGVAAFGLNFLVQVFVLLYRAYKSPAIIDGRYRIVEVSGDKAPCSFANNIFINPANYEWETYNQILQHEKVHIRQRHSIDLLLAELVLIFQWFNPFAWIYRKEMENNLEFLTDNHLVQFEQIEKSSYQMSLLRVSSPQLPLSLTTNYNQSLLKKRIAMMNSKKSNLHTAWKYFFLLPVLFLLASLLNDPVAQEKQKKSGQIENNANVNVESPEEIKQDVRSNQQLKVNTKTETNQNRNASANVKVNTQTNENANVSTRGIETEGSWFAVIKGDKVQFQFRSNDDEYNSNSSSFQLSELPNLPRGTAGTFKITREAGTMEFNGKFEDDRGMGTYKFIADKQYTSDVDGNMEGSLSDKDIMVFFFLDVKRSYVKMLKGEFGEMKKNDVIPMAALKIDADYIKALKASGLGEMTIHNIIPFKSLGIDGAYIREIRDAGFKDISASQLISYKSQNITGDYIRRMLSEDKSISPGDIIAYKSLKIDDAYINSFRQVGMTEISRHDIIPMKSLGITADYVKGFQQIGYQQIKPRDLIPLKSQRITPEFIAGFESVGFKQIPLQEIISLKSIGVTPAYIKEMKEKGFNYDRVQKYITLKSIGDH